MTQPIKVFIVAVFIACVIKNIEREGKSVTEVIFTRYVEFKLQKFQQKPVSPPPEFHIDLTMKVADRIKKGMEKEDDIMKPITKKKLLVHQRKQYIQLRMHQELRELCMVLVFTFLIYFLGHNLHDAKAFRQTQNIREMLKVTMRPMSKLMFKNKSVNGYLKVWQP